MSCASITTLLSLPASSHRAESSTQTLLKGTRAPWRGGHVGFQPEPRPLPTLLVHQPVLALPASPRDGSPAWWWLLGVGWRGRLGEAPALHSHMRLSGVVCRSPCWCGCCGAGLTLAGLAFYACCCLLLSWWCCHQITCEPRLEGEGAGQGLVPLSPSAALAMAEAAPEGDLCPQPWGCSFWRGCVWRRRRKGLVGWPQHKWAQHPRKLGPQPCSLRPVSLASPCSCCIFSFYHRSFCSKNVFHPACPRLSVWSVFWVMIWFLAILSL